MRNVFLLIQRFSILLLFLGLQVLSISLLVRYNKSHEARYLEWSYEITGRINKRYSTATGYLKLGENNRLLAAENNRLRNLLGSNFTTIDSSGRLVADSIGLDSSTTTRKFLWRNAKVVNNSVSSQNNMITIERGRLQGVAPDMAVMAPGGIVGLVTDVSNNMAIVMSLLHRKSSASVMLKRGGITGILDWDGRNPLLLQLNGIPKSAELKIGDTVLTSNISLNYPPGLMVGTVARFVPEKAGNNYAIDVRPGANFYSLEYVDVIENLQLNEQLELEKKAKKQQ
jgi:rod shape-determining protein MreC